MENTFDLNYAFEKFKPKNLQDCGRVANYLCTGSSLQYHPQVKFGLFQKILEISPDGIIGIETTAEQFFGVS
jgi:hypothetical protein